MKFVRYRTPEGPERLGLCEKGVIRPLHESTTLAAVLTGQDLVLESGAPPVETGHVLLAPTGIPPSVRDFMSFEEHVVTSMAALGRTVDPVWYEQPVFYFSNPAAVIGPDADVPVSPGSNEFDFELEIAAVIGRPGADIDVADADSHIAGYTLLCDWSARDHQEKEMKVGLGPAKGKDGATTIGPHLITPDDLEHLRRGNGYDVDLTVDVNGRRYSHGNWSTLHWSFPQMIAFASRGTTLRTGDVIGSGTVGTGCILELGRVHGFDRYPYLVPGDVVAIDGGPLGSLTQRIVPGPAPARITLT